MIFMKNKKKEMSDIKYEVDDNDDKEDEKRYTDKEFEMKDKKTERYYISLCFALFILHFF